MAVASLAGCGEGAAAARTDDARRAPTAAPAAPPGFPDLSVPEPGADVEVLELDASVMARPVRLLLDAGHGAADNAGNTSSFGVAEQDFTLDLALDVAALLESTGGFEVRLSRSPGETVVYAARVEAARAMGADAFVSLHSDVRGTTRPWSPMPGVEARAAVDAPGFSVLFADEGDPALARRRRGLAIAVAREMSAAGFFPYGGAEYEGLYAADAEAPGAFVDRHDDAKRIFVLRRTPMPAVIVETHNALDPREAARWDEAWHRRAFAMALARGLAAAVAAPTGPATLASPG
jgi:N-acetylmuramoyl-L-alanine amidase